MIGAPLARVTVSVARVLKTVPAALEITTLKLAPESEVMAAGISKEAAVAPVIVTPFFFHK
jgi:hypothetical protein